MPKPTPSNTRSMVLASLLALTGVAVLCAVLGALGCLHLPDGSDALQSALEALGWVALAMGGVGAGPAAARKIGGLRRTPE